MSQNPYETLQKRGFWEKKGDPAMGAEMGNSSSKSGLKPWGGTIVPLSARKILKYLFIIDLFDSFIISFHS